jgi:flagellar hook-associated protein 2
VGRIVVANNLGIDGLASGFKTHEVVQKLMAVERQPLVQLENKKNTINSQADSWRELNTRLNAVKDAAYQLQSAETFRSRAVTVSDNEAFTAVAATGASLGKHQVAVKQMAKSHCLTSSLLNSADRPLKLNGVIKINDQAVTIANTDSLKKIAEKINQTAKVNVTAAVVHVDDTHYQLVLSSKETAKPITFKDGGMGKGILTKLGVLNLRNKVIHETQAPQNAIVALDGVEVERASNKIVDAIPNVTLTLKKGQTEAEVTIESDKEKLIAAAKNFVEKYNSLAEYINQNTGRGISSPFFGDSTLMTVQSGVRRALLTEVGGVDESVALLDLVGIKGKPGIEGAKSGELEFDETIFRAKLDRNYDDIGRLFGAVGANGIFKQMYDVLFDMTGPTGLISNNIKASGKQIDDLNKRITATNERLDAKEQAYYKKFNVMEQTLMKLKNQGNWMSAQLGTLNNNSNNDQNGSSGVAF